MDQDEARKRVEIGGSLLCLDFPAGKEFGFDLKTWIGILSKV